MNLIIVALLLIVKNVQSRTRIDPLVNTKAGLIRGLKASDGDYSMFMGIPYAIVDESNPFGPPVPFTTVLEEFEAFDDSAQCPQLENNIAVGTIDCLYLNIYVPNSASSNNRLPVLVWFYGGNFERGYAGRSLYGPKYLVRHDVILVTVNYRIGPYGFMCLDIPEVPGNQGLKDQVTSLRWINENIESFGGDKSSITIFGESSGGRSVDFHLISSQEKLFSKAIMQSGTSLIRATFVEPDKDAPIKIAEVIGFTTTDLKEALDFLATVDPITVINAANDIDLLVSPCVEKEFDDVENFITDYTFNLRIPKAKQVPILIGHNEIEQIARYVNKDASYYENLDLIYNRLKESFDFENETLEEMESYVRHFYLGDNEKNSQESMWDLIKFDSDFSYCHPTQRSIRMYLENGAVNVFYYVFSYSGGRNYYKDINGVTDKGAGHADELAYLFDMAYYGDASPGDQLIIDRMTTLWTNFAKYSNPTPEITELLPIKWLPVTQDQMNYVNIDFIIEAKNRPYHKRTSFWDFFYKSNWNYQKGIEKE